MRRYLEAAMVKQSCLFSLTYDLYYYVPMHPYFNSKGYSWLIKVYCDASVVPISASGNLLKLAPVSF